MVNLRPSYQISQISLSIFWDSKKEKEKYDGQIFLVCFLIQKLSEQGVLIGQLGQVGQLNKGQNEIKKWFVKKKIAGKNLWTVQRKFRVAAFWEIWKTGKS